MCVVLKFVFLLVRRLAPLEREQGVHSQGLAPLEREQPEEKLVQRELVHQAWELELGLELQAWELELVRPVLVAPRDLVQREPLGPEPEPAYH